MILHEILEHKRTEVEARKAAMPLRELKSRVSDAPVPLDFAKRLARNGAGLPAVIAEVKKASPSKGVIRVDFDPVGIARSYEVGGAAAISVLTDERFFQGSMENLRFVKRTVSLPVLRKDFIVDEYQVFESRAAGADAILLIAAALEANELGDLMDAAAEIGLACLVEVHDEAEMDTALDARAALVGINNRDLKTFDVSLDTTERLLNHASERLKADAPTGPTALAGKGPRFVSESGIFTRDDLVRLGRTGVDAVLIGEALMREPNIQARLRELTA